MLESDFTVKENIPLAKNIFTLKLKGDTSQIKNPGEFVNIALPGFALRRPISVSDKNGDELCLVIKAVGSGTTYLSGLSCGDKLNLLTGLGNGFDTSVSGDNPLLVGGGIGCAPLFFLGKTLAEQGKHPIFICGFNTKDEAFNLKEIERFASKLFVTTNDGSIGRKGFVTDELKNLPKETYSYVYSCGPEVMMAGVDKIICSDAQYSLEERFGCGFGSCMGCSRKTKNGFKRVCKDGPVFYREEMIWQI